MIAGPRYIAASLVLLAAPACASSAVSSRAAHDFGCLGMRITVEHQGGDRYTAEGCDLRATYTCTGSTCVRESEIEDRRGARRAAEAPGAYLSAHGANLQRCAGSEGELALVFDPRGSLEQIESWEGETPEARECLADALAGTRLDAPQLEETVLRVDLARMEIVPDDRPRQGAEPRTPAPESAPAAEPAPVPAPPPTAEPAQASETDATEQRLRAALDERTGDILDCAAADRVVLHLQWTESSPPRVSVQGELSGTPNEGCIRAALAEDLSISPGSPGALIHLVSR